MASTDRSRPRLRCLLAVLLLLLAAQAHAQLPGFLQVGSRLSWHAGGSSLEGSRFVPDPNGWIWQNNQWNRLEATRGGGGVGFVQIGILSASAEAVVGDVRSFINTDLQAGIHVAGGVDAILGDASALGEYWVAPARLAAMQPGFDGLTRVWRGPRVIDGRQLDTVSIATISQGSYHSHTYDLASGLLIFGGTMDAQTGTLVTDDSGAVLQQNRGAVSYTHLAFMGVRQVEVPWADRALPDWVTVGLNLSYQGESRAEFASAGGLPPLAGQPVAVGYTFDRRLGSAIIGRQFTQSATTQGLPPFESMNARAFGSAMFDGLWAAPDVLQRLQPNQVLDQDPITGQRVYFAGMQGDHALIVLQGSGDVQEMYFERNSGFLAFSRYRRAAANIGTQVTELWYVGAR